MIAAARPAPALEAMAFVISELEQMLPVIRTATDTSDSQNATADEQTVQRRKVELVAACLFDPAEWALGVKPQGPCTATVFDDQI